MTEELKNRLLSILKFVFAAVLFIAVVATLYHELAHINFKQTLEAFSKINRWYIVGLFICGGSAMILLSLYDLILVKGLKLDIPLIRVFKISYIINALNAIVGFGGFIGAGFRAFIYKNYTTDRKN